MYECLNPHCRKYAGRRMTLGLGGTFDFDGEVRCLECGRPVRVRFGLPVEMMLAVPLVIGIAMVVMLAFTQ